MNRSSLATGSRAAALLIGLVLLAGCASYHAENQPLTEFPGIQSQIENFYDANATEDPRVIRKAIAAGAMAYVPKSLGRSSIAEALRHVLVGETWQPENKAQLCAGDSTRL